MVRFPTWKIILVLIVAFFGLSFAVPNILPSGILKQVPSWLPHKHMNLGLDLRGGAHLLLEAEINVAVRESLGSLRQGARDEFRQKPRILHRNLKVDGNGITVEIVKDGDVEEASKRLRRVGQGMELDRNDKVLALSMTETQLRERRNAVMEQAMEIVRRRLDETGLSEPSIQRQGSNRILVQAPGFSDTTELKKVLGQTAKMTFHLLAPEVATTNAKERPGPGILIIPGAQKEQNARGERLYYLVKKRVEVSGENLVDAQPSVDQNNRNVVSFRFDAVGARKFGNVTRRNVNKPFAIVLDGEVITAPVIQEPILGGNGQISGTFTPQESKRLALLLRSGALPVPLEIIEERTVGPGLGADSIAAGKIASMFGLVAVVVFMALAYGLFGLMAVVALILNLILIAAALSMLQATLTLPGIAGIVLTIGMAVDANVLVFERIREEVRAGRTPISAVDSGYQRAFSTIIDANLTTFIAALLLYMFGSGPVKGFAVTLGIGICTSMFSAIMVTRMMVVTWLRQKRPKTLPL